MREPQGLTDDGLGKTRLTFDLASFSPLAVT